VRCCCAARSCAPIWFEAGHPRIGPGTGVAASGAAAAAMADPTTQRAVTPSFDQNSCCASLCSLGGVITVVGRWWWTAGGLQWPGLASPGPGVALIGSAFWLRGAFVLSRAFRPEFQRTIAPRAPIHRQHGNRGPAPRRQANEGPRPPSASAATSWPSSCRHVWSRCSHPPGRGAAWIMARRGCPGANRIGVIACTDARRPPQGVRRIRAKQGPWRCRSTRKLRQG